MSSLEKATSYIDNIVVRAVTSVEVPFLRDAVISLAAVIRDGMAALDERNELLTKIYDMVDRRLDEDEIFVEDKDLYGEILRLIG